MASSDSTIGEVLSRSDARVADTGVDSLNWREISKEKLLKEHLVPLVPELSVHDVDGTSSLSPAGVQKLVKYLKEVENKN